MKIYRGTENAEAGIYFNPRRLAFRSLEDEGRLPGTTEDTWRRVPALALLVAGPVLGLAYAIFLPLLGFTMVGSVLLRKAGELAVEATHATARVLSPAWQPARAFLSRRGRRPRKGAERPQRGDDRWADEVRRQMNAERDEELVNEEPDGREGR